MKNENLEGRARKGCRSRGASDGGRAFLRDWREERLPGSNELEALRGQSFVLAVTTAAHEDIDPNDEPELGVFRTAACTKPCLGACGSNAPAGRL